MGDLGPVLSHLRLSHHLKLWWDVRDSMMWPGHVRQLRKGLTGQRGPICLLNPVLFQRALQDWLFRLIQWPGLRFFNDMTPTQGVGGDFVAPSRLHSDAVNWWAAQNSFSSAGFRRVSRVHWYHLILVRDWKAQLSQSGERGISRGQLWELKSKA